MPKSIKDILAELNEVQEKAPETFLKRIVSRVETFIWKQINRFISDSDQKGGFFLDSDTNLSLMTEISELVDDAYIKSGVENVVNNYLEEFDVTESLVKELYRRTLSSGSQKDLTKLFRETRVLKTQILDDITLSLLDKNVFKSNITNEYRNILFESIVFNKKVSETRSQLRELIRTNDDGNSKLLRYTKQITQDSLAQYEGGLQDSIRTEFNLDGFSYTGSIISTSRANCVNLTCTKRHPKFNGKFDAFKLKNTRGFRVSDIPRIIQVAKTGDSSGFNPLVTPSTFSLYRMGFNCRHSVIYYRLLDDERPENAELNDLIGE